MAELSEELANLPLYENWSGVFAFACHRSRDLVFPHHLHSEVEVVLVEKGNIALQSGEASCLMRPGDCAVIFPGQIHSYETQGPSSLLLALCPVEMSGDFRRVLLRQAPVSPLIRERELHRDVSYAMRGLREIYSQDGSLPAARAFVQLILARTLPCLELVDNTHRPPADLTTRIVEWVAENYAGPVSLDILSEQLQVSKYQISRVFGEKLRTSLSDYVNQLRIDHARELLRRTEEDVLAVSRACGYENPRTFNREFKKLCGCTPREYRRKHTVCGRERQAASAAPEHEEG